MLRSTCLAAVLVLVPVVAAPRGEDLAKRYPATLTWSEQGLSWRCTPADVWELKSFDLSLGRDFELSCGKSTAALGVHGTNVLWAVVFPDQPARVRTKEHPGDGELATAILLRFAPAEIGRVFPAKTVAGTGSTWLRASAGRIFRRKIGHKWFTPSGSPTVVQAGFTLVDIDTASGVRRFYEHDANAGRLQYVPDFEGKPVPPDPPIAAQDAREAFEVVWGDFDREYAKFHLLPRLRWDKVGQEYRKLLSRVETRFDLAALLADMLAQLEDLHVWVRSGEDWLPGYERERPLNASHKATLGLLASSQKASDDLTYGRTDDGIGYLGLYGLNDANLPAQVDAALESLADTWSLVLDLRFNGGGDESLAREVAGRFVDQERVYSKNQYRSGPKNDALGPVLDRAFQPRGPWRFESPVTVLWGQRTLSSAESFALMLAQCPQVTTMGDRTGGSSGNPRLLELACGVAVNLPRWNDMDPEERPIERVGVKPDVQLDFAPEAFTESEDPVFAAALERLRKSPKGARKSGKRGS